MHLDRLISLMEIISVAGRPVSVVEIQRATDLPKPSCYRLIQTLLEQRLIEEPGGAGKYIIGERFIRIALLGKSDVDVRRCAAPLMRSASITFNETVFLARFRASKVEIIHIETPDDPNRAFINPGLDERPMHACSCSKAIAAFTEPEFQDLILSHSLKQYTEHTKINIDELRAEFRLIVQQGYADCDQEIDIGIASVSAPITVGNIGATFSVGAVGPIRRFGKEYRQEIGEKLKQLSHKISGAIQLCNVTQL